MSDRLQFQIEQSPAAPVSIETVMTRGVESIMPEEGLRELLSEKRLRVYLGIDPTSPYLHIGHTVPLRKLHQLQQLGHEVVLLFGTFTGMIGDPSDKSATRVRLTSEEVNFNVATYKEQAGKILDLSPNATNPVLVVYNDEWLAPLNFKEVIELASYFTVNQLVARETYKKRLEAESPLYLHEFLYTLMQAYDAVCLDVDLEVGGKDQIPNMLAGARLVSQMNHHTKWVLGMKLIEDPSGAKMGKTSGNVVNITEWPEVIYESIMTWPDGAIPVGLESLTTVPMEIITEVRNELQRVAEGTTGINPMELKEATAYRIVAELNGHGDAGFARQVYHDVKRNKQRPPRIQEVTLTGSATILQALVASGLARNADEAQSKLTQQAVSLDHTPVRKNLSLDAGEYVIELGKRSIKNIRRIVIL